MSFQGEIKSNFHHFYFKGFQLQKTFSDLECAFNTIPLNNVPLITGHVYQIDYLDYMSCQILGAN